MIVRRRLAGTRYGIGLFFALCFLAGAGAETVREKFLSDSSFLLYAVIFEITPRSDGSVEEIKVAGIKSPRSDSKEKADVDLPSTYVAKAKEMLTKKRYEPKIEDDKVKPVYSYFYYAPELGDLLIDDLNAEIASMPHLLPDKPTGLESHQVSSFDEAIAPYVEKARATYPEARQRYSAGLPPGYLFLVTTRLRDQDGKWEQVFIKVHSIIGGTIYGTITNDLNVVKAFKKDDEHTLTDDQVLDWTILDPTGREEGNFVGKFLDTYNP